VIRVAPYMTIGRSVI